MGVCESKESRMILAYLSWANGKTVSHLLILRALAGEQIREKRFGANNSGHVELEVPSLEMSSRQSSN